MIVLKSKSNTRRDMRLENKTAIITGGSRGIGKAIAEKFQDEGAKVTVFDIERPEYDVEFFQVDITNEDQIKKAVDQIEKLDILVNNAGIYFQEPVENKEKKQLDNIVDIN